MSSIERIGDELADGEYRLLVPISEEMTSVDTDRRLRTAAAIARERGGGLVVCYVVTFAPQTPLDGIESDDPTLVAARETTAEFVATAAETGVPTTGRVHPAHEVSGLVLNAVEAYDCDGVALAIDAERSQRQRLLGRDAVEKLVSRAECEVFVEKQAADETPIERILLAVSAGPHSGLAARTARALALDTGAHVEVVHFLPEDASDDDHEEGAQIIEAAEGVLSGVERVETALEPAENAAETIIARSDEYDVTVLGSPTGGLLAQFVFGTVPDSVNQRTENAVLMTKDDTGSTSIYERWVAGDRTEE